MSCEGALEPLSPRGRGRGLPRERWEGEGVGVRSCSIIYSVMRLRRSPSSGPCFAGATFSRVGEKGGGIPFLVIVRLDRTIQYPLGCRLWHGG